MAATVKPREESRRKKLLVIPLLLLVIGMVAAAWLWQCSPSYRAQEERDQLPYRLAALLNEKEELEIGLRFVEAELRKVDAHIAEQPNAAEIRSEAEHIRTILRRNGH